MEFYSHSERETEDLGARLGERLQPGTVIAYDRNVVTNRIFEENGIRVLKMPGGELSRGRGGPRCMSMPLNRETN